MKFAAVFSILAKMAFATILALGLVCGPTTPVHAQWRPSTPPLTIEKMAEDWALSGVVISPDGKHVAGIAGRSGKLPVIKIWKTDDLTAPPVAIDSKSIYFRSLTFIKNDRLFISGNQPVSAGTVSAWYSKVIITDLEGKVFIEPLSTAGETAQVNLVSRLPDDPDNILLEYLSDDRTIDLVKFNVKTEREQRIARASNLERYIHAGIDRKDEPRLKSDLALDNGAYIQRIFYKTDAGEWVEQKGLRDDIAQRRTLEFIRLNDTADKAWVSTNIGSNFSSIRIWDFKTQSLSEPLFQNTEFDTTSPIFWSPENTNSATGDVPIGAFCFNGPSRECIYQDEVLKRIEARVSRALPNKTITIRAVDGGKTALIKATSPNFPDTWYVLKNEKQMIRLGSLLEGVDVKHLGTAQWVEYAARDGLKIPAIVYLPPGYDKNRDGKLPLVVMPHGGPWARDEMDYDASHWAQMFATRGFALLLPQYRGTSGLGRQLWIAGDKEWGLKMQDDKDDGAKWLVELGVVDPQRMMMFGYSYGGFAAAAAAARSGGASKGLWQCAISGAPVIDMDRLRINEWGENRAQRKFQGHTVRGFNPQANLEAVEIPWLIFHGDYDRQADTSYSRAAAARMKQLQKPNFKYVEIKKMAHTLLEMTPDMRRQFMTLILDWTNSNCGMVSSGAAK